MGISYIVIGTIGGIFNILLFTRRSLRVLSPCIPLMLAANVANMINLYSYTPLRTLVGFQITFVYYSSIACKLQFYLFYTSVCASTWFMAACCVDRFFSSSLNVGVRRYSNMRNAYRSILAITIFILLFWSEAFYCFDANQIGKPGPCYTRDNACAIFDTIFAYIFQAIGPPICMIIFGIGTFIHIHQGRRIRSTQMSIEMIETTNRRETSNIGDVRGKNRSILRMLIGQLLLYIVCTMPLLIFKLYIALPLTIDKSNLRRSVENLILNISIFLQLIDKTFAFFIYTATSKYFRQEFIKLFKHHDRHRHV
ncbi:unnamed protein product [Adineta ricciae]|uniref:G-protein coupled receptors family 1 profile domain-containing protein n=1 Tax=Adineta ricciae TaxID=249248 RepID=A0A814F0I7_ADIRI|nr:unnamed protein product [Adineta ricciae]